MASLIEKVEERKKYAIQQRINEKAAVIAEVLGTKTGKSHESFTISNSTYFLSPTNKFIDDKIRIMADSNHNSRKHIGLVNRSSKNGREYISTAYAEDNGKILAFRKEKLWLDYFNKLHQKAVDIKHKNAKDNKRRESGRLRDNFGLKSSNN